MVTKPRTAVWSVLVFVAWTAFVWLNRVSNALRNDSLGTSGKGWSIVLSVSVLAGAVGAAVVAVRGWSRPWTSAEAVVLKVAAGWTALLWLVLVPKILIDGRPAGFSGNLAGFKAVHTVLGLASLALSAWVWRSASRDEAGADSLQPAGRQ